MIYISLASVIILHIYLFSRRGLLDPVSVFFLAFLYYSYLTPISMSLYGQYDVQLLGQMNWITQDTIDKSAILYFIGYSAYALPYYALSKKNNFENYSLKNNSANFLLKDSYARIVLIFVSITIGVITIFFRDDLLASTESYEGKISGNYTASGYAFFINSALTLLSLLANYLILNLRRHTIAASIFIIMFCLIAVLTFSKAPFIYAALCAFCSLYRYRKFPFWLTLTALIVGMLISTMFFIPAFSIYRGSGEFILAVPDADALSLVLSEASGPFAIMHLALNGYVSVDNHPLWHSFVLWMPRAVWADRPLDIAEGFAQQVIVGWQAGFGLGFSPFAEGFARYGMAGSALFMAMVGSVTALLQTVLSRFVPKPVRIPTMLTIGGIVSVLVLRGAFSGLITQAIQNWVPVIIVSAIAAEISRRGMANSSVEAGRPLLQRTTLS